MSVERPRPRGLGWFWGVVALLIAGAAIAFSSGSPGTGGTHATGGSGEAGTGDAGQPHGAARVRGKVVLEFPPEAPAQQPDVGSPEPVKPQLRPAQNCSVVAWQRGVRVGGPTACGDQGAFEVTLQPGTTGPAAFEVLVAGRLRAVLEVEVPSSGAARLPSVALGVAQAVSGQVVDARGQALASVDIEAMPVPNLQEPEPWRTTTDAQGRFSLDTLPPGPVALRASKPGHTASVVEAIAPQDDVLITVGAVLDLRGEVVGEASLLARARVRIEGSAIWPAKEQPLAEDGSFAIEGIPDGVYGLEAVVTATEPGEPEFATVPLENVTPDLHVTLALTRAHRVPVYVRGPDGRPVAGARVTLGNSQVGLLNRVATTGEDGRLSIGPVVPGSYVLRADADGYLPADPLSLTVESDALPEQELVLSRPGRIEGIVVDEDDRPIKDAIVFVDTDALYTAGEGQARASVFQTALVAAGSLGVTKGPVPAIPLGDDDSPQFDRRPTTDGDGRFVLPDLGPGQYTLWAIHGRYAQSGRKQVRVRGGQYVSGVRLVLRRGHLLTGRVVDGNHRPVADASVVLEDGGAYRTDRRGAFDVGYQRGRTALVARAEGKAPRRVVVTVRGRMDIEIQLPDADGRTRGRVDDGNGQPIEGARVTLRSRDGLSATQIEWTDVRGLYAFAAVPLGPAQLTFEHGEHLAKTRDITVTRADGPLDVTLEQGWAVDLFVRDPGTKDPIRGATVAAQGRLAYTDASGEATLDGLSGPRVKIRVSADGFSARSVAVQRPPGNRADVEIPLTPGGAISGRVIDYRGDPVPGSLVVVRSAGGREVLAQTRTASGGRYSVDGLPEGDIVVEAFPPQSREEDLAAVAQPSDVLLGRVTKEVDLRFDRR